MAGGGAPPAARFAELARHDWQVAVEAARLNARLIAADLFELGITVDCAPVLDVPHPDGDPVIGDRAAGDTPELAALLGGAACEGFLAGGVLPVIKHLPGHGRASVDSHVALPVVDAPLAELERTDLPPFIALHHMPWAMTAHVVYTAIDPSAPATLSARVVAEVIRGRIGFEGVLVSDDLCMGALSGTPARRSAAALAAGCDVLLHCNGVLAEMQDCAEGCAPLTAAATERLARGDAMRRKPDSFDSAAAVDRLDTLLAAVGA